MYSNENQQYRDILLQHFEKKKNRNTRYSLRAFARDLEVPVSRLSDVFSGKKSPSLPMAVHVATKLGLPPLQRDLFVTSVQFEKEKIQCRKQLVEKKLQAIFHKFKNQWRLEQFDQGSKWLDHSICQALNLSAGLKTAEDFAQFFDVCPEEVQASLRSLEESKKILRTENGWTVAGSLRLKEDNPVSATNPCFQAEILNKAKESIEKDSSEIRDFTNVIFSFNTQDLPQIKKRISEMRDQLMLEFGQSKDADAIYGLALSLFPISKK